MKSRFLLFGLVSVIVVTIAATCYAQYPDSMTPRHSTSVRDRPPEEASGKPLIVVITDDCGIELVANFEFNLKVNKGKELKFWAGRPLILVNKSGRVAVLRFGSGAVGRREWSPIGRNAVRLNPGEVYRTRLRKGRDEGEAEITLICAGKRPESKKNKTTNNTGWDGPPREPDEPPQEEPGG
jgi:hypothetical protein